MKNLAGVKTCDDEIRRELTRCGIEVVEHDESNGREVNARLTGKLGAFTFSRLWYYWAVKGPMPLASAKRLYDHPVGRTDIRVAGHCGCPAPEHPWVEHYDADGKQLVHDPDGEQLADWIKTEEETTREGFAVKLRAERLKIRFVPDAAAAAAKSFVESYHVDSELGLYVLAEAIRALDAPPPAGEEGGA